MLLDKSILPAVCHGSAQLMGTGSRAPRILSRQNLSSARTKPGMWVRMGTAVDNTTSPSTATAEAAALKVVQDVPVLPFQRLLCANRGEIAVRVFRAGIELGLRTVAIYSPADRLQPHRFKADESYAVGSPGMTPVQCYLDVEGVIAVAKQNQVDAIHPGYGFMSENATFARRCAEEGITFVGPRAETIEALGDKTEARKMAEQCGVPVVPGTSRATTSNEEALQFAKENGFPVILKAAKGGGGRGMRVARSDGELEDAFERASKEALAAFGDGSMFIEKFVEDPRHIEVQILADQHGNVMHLYERDCSVQRRHQKVVEIAPAFALDEKVKAAIHADAVRLAQHVGYCNAGTVEFMVDKHGDYFFLEVNPRIQVEHTVTEEVTGVDLVQAQLLIAGGATLASIGLRSQADLLPPNGFAIQCRITTEDPQLNFQPDAGRISAYRSPGGPGIRLDGALTAGNYVSPHYDSLLVKVICHSSSFRGSIQKMLRAMHEFQIRGVKTNIPFLDNLLRHPDFVAGKATTSFIGQNPQLFDFGPQDVVEASKLLNFLAEMVVNGPNHPGATGPPPAKITPPPPAIPKSIPAPRAPAAAVSTSEPADRHQNGKGTEEQAGSSGQGLTGWRDILLAEGPDAWAKAVRAHQGTLITDTTWRDAHQSLLATRVRTHDMCQAAAATGAVLRDAGSLEMWGGATFDVALRFLHEDPWRRLELLRERIPHIPFQMLLRGVNAVGYTSYPDNVVNSFVKEAHTAGIDIFRVFDSLNYVDNLLFGLDAVQAAGGVAEGTLCYSGDLTNPNKRKFTLEYYLELAEKLVAHGVTTLGIKDMAGLLKPRAANLLVSSLRKAFPDVPVHVHTHDTAGTGVATQLASVEAGADIVDCCLDAMSGTTSQPSMGAIVNSLAGTDKDTGIQPEHLADLNIFWEATRALYLPYESDMKSTSADVYDHEMPGGQYTNLRIQAASLGLGDEWQKVKKAYIMANRALGDIIKVTPSSKVVGDLAQFMVSNDLDDATLLEKAGSLSLPSSVVEYLQGYLGQPPGGFPEPLRSRVLKDKARVEGRPGANMRPLNLTTLRGNLQEKFYGKRISHRDVLSAALYPQVFDAFMATQERYSRFLEALPTRAFLVPLEEDEEVEVEVSRGNVVPIKFKAISELQPNGVREAFFEVNGVPRVVEVVDKKAGATGKVAREQVDKTSLGSVGAPMSGEVVEISVKPGATVKSGQQLVVLSAMKMETSVSAPCSGVVQHVAVEGGDQVDSGDLLIRIESDPDESPLMSTDER